MDIDTNIRSNADVSPEAEIGEGTKIWDWAKIRENSVIGKNCIVAKGVYIEDFVHIGDNVKIGNNASIFKGVTIKDGVFIGPHVCFTNDKTPRAINPDGSLQGARDWKVVDTLVENGASIGANSTIVCGVTIGKFAMIGAGSVVTKDVPAYSLVYGNPAKVKGRVDKSGKRT
ncbi:MAG TPA: acyltransferase [Methanosarcinales archaeon]|nr:acyltransferase [Methanosarcinales archaeon]